MSTPPRDPETGQFIAGGMPAGFSDIEVATFQATVGVQAADLSGTTGFGGEDDQANGIELLDYDEFVDRDEELMLLTADHRMEVFVNSTETSDGTLRVFAEISASPTVQSVQFAVTTNSFGDDAIVGRVAQDDSIDIIGRPLDATGHAPFSDGASGVGGGGSAGDDQVKVVHPPAEFSRFHPRDELFLNISFEQWNLSDASTHAVVTGQHVYGVTEG